MIPGRSSALEAADFAFVDKLVPDCGQDMRVDALIEGASIGNLLFDDPHGGHAMAIEKAQKALPRDRFPFLARQFRHAPFPFIYIIAVCLARPACREASLIVDFVAIITGFLGFGTNRDQGGRHPARAISGANPIPESTSSCMEGGDAAWLLFVNLLPHGGTTARSKIIAYR